MAIMELKNISLDLDNNRIIDGLSAELWEGYIHAIVGPNGSGKTSLSYTIMGLDGYRDFSGDIIFKGKSLKELDIYQRAKLGITLAWQEPARYEGLGVKNFVLSSSKKKNNDIYEDVMYKVGMEPAEYAGRSVDKSLSGGERKKIELASILVMKPELVILDEPDSGIDVASLQRIFEAMKYLKENGSTIMMITHSLEVLKQAEHAFIMCNGNIIRKGKVQDIMGYFGDKCLICDHKNEPE